MIEVKCAVCGAELYNEYHHHPPNAKNGREHLFITVDPCEKCLIAAEKGARANDFHDKAVLSTLTGIIASTPYDAGFKTKDTAESCYIMADALLKERDRRQTEQDAGKG